MKALILAGGEGTRLRPLTLAMPKPVVPVVNVPFLRYQLELLHKHGVHEVILSLGYQPQKIEAVLGDGSAIGVKIHYVVEQSPLGTGGAYKNAEALLDGPTIVFNGDILCDLDLTAVVRQHESHRAAATLVLTRVENPSAYGLVETTNEGRITRFLEKPSADEITCNTINAGAYILEPEVLKMIPGAENYSFERGVFPELLRAQRPVYAYVSEGYWIDIGTPQKYMQVHQDILHKRFCPAVTPADAPASIAATAHVDKNSQFAAGVVIGEGARIQSSSLGEGCSIGKNAVVESSVLWPGVSIGDNARLIDCVAGRNCWIGRHAVISRGVVLGDHSVVTDYSLLSSEGTARSYV
ncbi:MAG: NDP-sugar synthase [Acidobacteria bacterium]|nr:NDP-sugar synthase [Acidobacteriota bacterium]MCI0717542.1 NDP-sugar synthase [Acidobacteriota bacterium]